VILRHVFTPSDNLRLSHLCGALDENLRTIEHALGVKLTRRHEAFRTSAVESRPSAALRAGSGHPGSPPADAQAFA